MPALTWQDLLAQARSEQDVVMIARDFVALLTPQDIAGLPEACRPPKLAGAEDVNAYSFDLVRHHCEAHAEEAELVFRLAGFFSQAAMRLSQLLAATNEENLVNWETARGNNAAA